MAQASDVRWVEVSPSQFTHEAEGLAVVRKLLPDASPYRAWSNFEFRDSRGNWHEVDLLLLGRGRLHLIELKYYSGTLRGDDYTWRRDGHRPERSPLLPRPPQGPVLRHQAPRRAPRLGRRDRRPHPRRARRHPVGPGVGVPAPPELPLPPPTRQDDQPLRARRPRSDIGPRPHLRPHPRGARQQPHRPQPGAASSPS